MDWNVCERKESRMTPRALMGATGEEGAAIFQDGLAMGGAGFGRDKVCFGHNNFYRLYFEII